MPSLRQLGTYLERSFGEEEARLWVFGSRVLCGALERRLAGHESESAVRRVSVMCVRSGPIESPWVSEQGYGEVRIQREVVPPSTLDDVARHEQYIEVLLAGLEDVADSWSLPMVPIADAVEEFRRGGYRHAWVQDERRWRSGAVESTVTARVELDRFVLQQRVVVDGEVHEAEIGTAAPREALYAPLLGRVVLGRESGRLEYRAGGEVRATFDLDARRFETFPR